MRECGLKLKLPAWITNHGESLPVRECGLKFDGAAVTFEGECVTPCAGVWIEIIWGIKMVTQKLVTPCAGVWIEIFVEDAKAEIDRVTPCAGVWIEIIGLANGINSGAVTPCAGVWIEMDYCHGQRRKLMSLPVRECGLKSVTEYSPDRYRQSLPVRECGLK